MKELIVVLIELLKTLLELNPLACLLIMVVVTGFIAVTIQAIIFALWGTLYVIHQILN